MTAPTLALGISAPGAEQVIALAKSVADLRSNLEALSRTNSGAGSSLNGLEAMVSEMRQLRQEMTASLAGIRTTLTEGFGRMYADAAKAVDVGAAKVVEAQERAAAKIRVSGAKVALGAGASGGASGSGIDSLGSVKALTESLKARPEALAASAEANAIAFEKWSFGMNRGIAKLLSTMNEAQLAEAAGTDKWVLGMNRNLSKFTAAREQQVLKQQLASDQWLQSIKLVSAKMAAAQAEASAREIEALKLAEMQKDAAYNAANERGKIRMVMRARSQLDAGISGSSVSGSFGPLAAEAAAAAPSLAALRSQMDEMGKKTKEITPHVANLKAEMSDLHSAARGMSSAFGSMLPAWGAMIPLLAGAALGTGFVQVIKMGAEVGHTFEIMRVLSEESIKSIDGLETQMMSLAKNGPFGPLEIARAMKEMSLAGLNAEQVGTAIKDVLNFAIAGTTSISQAADTLTSVGVAFKISASGYNYISDVISKSAAISKSSVENMGQAFKSASVLNTQYGVSLQDVGLGLAVLANLSITGSAAGTSLRNFYLDIVGRTPKAREALKELGFTAYTADGQVKPLVQTIQELEGALSKFSGKSQTKFLSDIFSQRGDKSAVSFIDQVRTAAKDAGTATLSELASLRLQIENAAGFTMNSVAALALTPLNQMKSVVATLQAQLVGAFSAAEPYVLDVSMKLKEAFNSPEFSNGLSKMVNGIGALTLAIVNHIDVIGVLLTAYIGFKVVSGISAMIMATSESLALYSVNATRAAVATVELTAAQEVQQIAAVGAASKLAQFAGTASLVMGVVSKVTFWLGLAVAAWQLYDFWTSKSSSSHIASTSTADALIESLRSEGARLKEVNDAKERGINLDELKKQKASEAAFSVAQTSLDAEPNKAKADYDRIKAKLDQNPNSAFAPQLQKDAEAADLLYRRLKNIADQKRETIRLEMDNNVSEAERNKALEKAAEAKRKADADAAARAGLGGNPLGEYAGKVKGGKGGAHGAMPRMAVDAEAAMVEQSMRLALNAERDGYSKSRLLLDAEHSAKVISEGSYQARLIALTDSSEDAQITLISNAQVKVKEIHDRRVLEAQASFSDPKVAGELDAELKLLKDKYDKFTDESVKDLAKINNESVMRPKMAAIKEQGETLQISKDTDAYLLAADRKIAKDKDVAAAAHNLAFASEDVRVRAEAEAKLQDTVNTELDKLAIGYATSAVALVDFYGELGDKKPSVKQAAALQTLTDKLDAYAAAITKVNTALPGLQQKVGDAAVLDAGNKTIEKLRTDADKMAKDVSGNFADAILTGGKNGGQKLETWFKDYFIKQPLKVLLQAVMQPMANGVANFAYGGLSGQKGGLGDVLGAGAGMTNPMAGTPYAGVFNMLGGSSGLMGSAQMGSLSSGGGWLGSLAGMLGMGSSAGIGGSFASSIGSGLATDAMGQTVLEGTAAAGLGGGMMGAIGTALPYLGIALAVASMLSTPGGGPKTEGGFAPTGMNIQGLDIGGKMQGSVRGDVTGAQGYATSISDAYAQVAKSMGLSKTQMDVGMFYAKDPNGTSQTQLQVVGGNYNRSTRLGGIENVGRSDAEFSAELKAEGSRVILQALRDSELAEKFKTYLNKIDIGADDATLQKALTAVTEVKQLQDMLLNLGSDFSNLNSLTVEASKGFIDMAGGLQTLVANLNSYYQNFYSPTEQRTQSVKNITRTLNDAGGSYSVEQIASMTRDQFRAQVELWAKDTTDKGQKVYAALLGVNAAFASINPVAAAAADSIQTAADALAALQSETDKAFTAFSDAISRQRTLVTAQQQVAQAAVNSLKGIFDLLTTQIDQLRGTVASTAAEDVGKANSFISQALSTAQKTGYMPDQTQLGSAISTASSGINVNNYATQQDFDFAKLALAGQLQQLKDIVGPQMTTAEKQLATANDELKRLDDTLTYWKDQVALVRSGNSLLASMDGSLAALKAALTKETAKTPQANGAPAAGTAGGAGFTGIQGSGGGTPAYTGSPGYAYQGGTAPTAAIAAAQGTWNDPRGNNWDVSAQMLAYAHTLTFGTDDKTAWTKLRDYAIGQGETMGTVASVLGFPVADVASLYAGYGLPAFRLGGSFNGGVRMVGEDGPEIEATGAAKYWTAQQTSSILGGSGAGDSRAIVQELRILNSRMSNIEAASKQTAKLLDGATGGGGPMLTTAA